LEAALIKKYSPKYNIALKDNKSYPMLKLTMREEFPRIFIVRKKIDDGSLYFGPYTNAKLLRQALKLIGRIFPLRKCKNPAQKPCLYSQIGECLAHGAIGKQDYRKMVDSLVLFLEGESEELKKNLLQDMDKASKDGNFELAAKIRDQVQALTSVRPGPSGGRQAPANKISLQLEDLARVLNLAKPPYAIEAFDISNIQGKQATGSMVVFKNGWPYKDSYRRFRIKTIRTIDDYSMMAEIVSRRYNYLFSQKLALPDLIIIDGGKGHLAAAKKQLQQLGIWQIPVVAIAKSFESIYTQVDKEPLNIAVSSPASLLIQRIRDEAHRFAITYHRVLRTKKLYESELDDIPGLGEMKKRQLLEHFGSMDEIKIAEPEDLMKVKYINEKQAKKIYDYFNNVSR
ncbi:MAG: excinuclease ABC subunit UvrC, partial [Candidatus Omnitrophica bacterium]|nr:excinuclease ABC subunit UvrC [Candidatus Omnitrophota bacterium]